MVQSRVNNGSYTAQAGKTCDTKDHVSANPGETARRI